MGHVPEFESSEIEIMSFFEAKQMRQKYIKTDSRYLIPSIINFIVIAVLLVTNMIEGVNQLIFCFFECGYIYLIVFCAVQKRKEQKKYLEIH